MNILTGFSDQPKQTTTIVLEDGSRARLDMEYVPQQKGWFYTLTYGEFVATGQRIVASPNLIRQFINQLPFGLAILTNNNTDPMNQDDFVNGKATVLLLDRSDVDLVEIARYTNE